MAMAANCIGTRMTARIVGVMLLVIVLASCASLERGESGRSVQPVQAYEEVNALHALKTLDTLEDADVHVRFDNQRLAGIMRDAFEQVAGREGALPLRDFEITFGHQSIRVVARLDRPEPGDGYRLTGDIGLAFSGGRLWWTPVFTQVHPVVTDPAEAGPESPDIRTSWVRAANESIAAPLIEEGLNGLDLDYFPIIRVEAGVAMEGLEQDKTTGARVLEGFFSQAGQALLIAPGQTSALLDLELRPNLSRCQPQLQVSRAAFTDAIRQREPGDFLTGAEPEQRVHFFTEVRGADRSTAVVHYWFADGQPAGLEELVIEPSERWRTWSTRPAGRAGVSNWEVVVVERDTACVLLSRSLRGVEPFETGPLAISGSYQTYRSAFEARLDGFSAWSVRPDPVMVETRESLLSGMAMALLPGIDIDLNIGFSGQQRPIEAELYAFPLDPGVCEKRSCAAVRVCQTAVSRCIRRHDTRHCGVCQFRNPLNNRCLNEVEDPVCVAARDIRNRLFEEERQFCLIEEERERAECEQLGAQEVRACELESRLAENVCASNLEALADLEAQGRLALVDGEMKIEGSAAARVRDFELAPGFASLKVEFELKTDAAYRGRWQMVPTTRAGGFAGCLESWRGPFDSRISLPAPRLSLVGRPERQGAAWVTSWSGFVLSAKLAPTPVESVFRQSPNLLSSCGISLTPEDVQVAVRGRHAAFLGGESELVIWPLRSRLSFGPDRIRFADRAYSTDKALDERGLQVRAVAGVGETGH